jgi:hypothetical protein
MYGHTYYGPRAWIAVPQLLIPLSPIHAQEDALAIQPEYQLPSDVGFGTGAVNSQDPLDPNRVGVRDKPNDPSSPPSAGEYRVCPAPFYCFDSNDKRNDKPTTANKS